MPLKSQYYRNSMFFVSNLFSSPKSEISSPFAAALYAYNCVNKLMIEV